MLRELEVRDLGIIDALQLELPPGFTVLTGETGAGKSLLVQSLQLLAGERADAEQVRGGCERLVVEGRFARPGAAAAGACLEELGVAAGDELVVRREVTAQRTLPRLGRRRRGHRRCAAAAGAVPPRDPRPARAARPGRPGHPRRRWSTPPAVSRRSAARSGQRSPPGARCASALGGQRRALARRRDRLDVIAFQVARDRGRAARGGRGRAAARGARAAASRASASASCWRGARGGLGGEGGTVGAGARRPRRARAAPRSASTAPSRRRASIRRGCWPRTAERELERICRSRAGRSAPTGGG